MKTTLAVCIACEALRQRLGVYFISMPELLDTMISMSRNRDNSELRKFEERIKNVTILILDDFGAEQSGCHYYKSVQQHEARDHHDKHAAE